MTRIAEIAERLYRLAKRREDEGIYTDAALCEEAAAYLTAALAAEPGEAVAVKPLVWEEIHQRRSDEDPSTEVIGFEASNGFGEWYWIEVRAADFVLHYPDADGSTKLFETERDTKAAAQADYEKRILSALAHHLPLKEEVERVLEALLRRDEINTCKHEETHRGGFLWEICDQCGAKWADDKGGKPEWSDPAEWVAARSLLSRIRAGAQEGWRPIETAPDHKLGPFLVCNNPKALNAFGRPSHVWCVGSIHSDDDGGFCAYDGFQKIHDLKLYMPVPLPAAHSPEAKGGRSC